MPLELDAAEDRLRVVLGLTDSIVFEFDAEGRYLAAWTHSDALLAMPRQKLLGRHISEVLDPQVAAQCMQSIQRVLAGGQPERFEYSLRLEGGPRSPSIGCVGCLEGERGGGSQ